MIKYIAILMVLGGCASYSETEFNGEKVYSVKCNGGLRTMANCYGQASKLCSEKNKKAVPLEKESSTSPVISNGNLYAAEKRSLMFKCE